MSFDATIKQLEQERRDAIDKEDQYHAEVEKYVRIGDLNTAAMYEHLENCAITTALELTDKIIELYENREDLVE